MKLSIIVPAYKEEGNILDVLNRITALGKEELQGLDREIIVIDDGSDDKTYELANQVKGIKLLKHEKNKGYF